MTSKEIEQERERIKEIIVREIDRVIKWREVNIKNRPKRIKSIFEKLKQNILFKIKN